MKLFPRFWRLCAYMLFASASTVALADPPTRAGRVADVSGTAWYFDADHGEWNRLIRNQTVAEGDRLRVDPRSRVSLRVGSASLWLDAGADAEFLQMDDSGVLLRLDKGALGLALRTSESAGEYRVETREGRSFPDGVGLYRIEQLAQGTRAQALQGRLRFESERSGALQRAWLRDGEQAEFSWADGPRTEHQALVRDSFSNWLLGQASALADAGTVSGEYVSSEMTGMEELDRNGRWEQAPEYGNVWIPTQVAPGWEPYRDGRWVWTRNWGWSWVDDLPWGFAPFHYGRWVVWRGRWCWTPGHYVARPVYAPALVTWRHTPGLTIGVTFRQPPPRGSWSPLPPREVYVPTYRHSDDYRNRMNRPYDGRPGPDRPRNLVGPQREQPRDNPRGQPQDHSRDTRTWNDRPREEPRRQDSGPPRNAVTPVVPAPVFAPPQVQPVGPARPDRSDEPYDQPRGRDRGRNDRERNSGAERVREAPPMNPIAQPAPAPIRPAMQPPMPAVQAPNTQMPPGAQRPAQPQQNQPDAVEREHPRKRIEDKDRDKRRADIER
ncbi:MAG: hypothetical protein H7Y28_04100 [Rhodoferax sp.]|nr:hypothetical protein [Rhodoferax sp.]